MQVFRSSGGKELLQVKPIDEALNKGKNLKVCTFVITISVGS